MCCVGVTGVSVRVLDAEMYQETQGFENLYSGVARVEQLEQELENGSKAKFRHSQF